MPHRPELAEHYRKYSEPAPSKQKKGIFARLLDTPDLPPQPSRFQEDVLVVGDPRFARGAREMLDLDPNVKQNVSKITLGPSRSSMNIAGEVKQPLEKFRMRGDPSGKKFRLGGAYSYDTKDVSINPETPDRMGTLAHELGHAAGYGEEEAEQSRKLFHMADPLEKNTGLVKETMTRIPLKKKKKIYAS